MKFQACIGSGKLGVMHLRDAETTKVQNGDLVLCEGTSAFFDYHGELSSDKLCRRCMREFYYCHSEQNQTGSLTAAIIGVKAIIHR